MEIPILSHSDHHEEFAEFVRTLPAEVQALNRPSNRLAGVGPGGRVYSIGGFLREAEERFPEWDVRDDWQHYKRVALRERASAWYQGHGFTL